MNRRDFLTFRSVREPDQMLDLECHTLYMRFIEASRVTAREADAGALEDASQGQAPSMTASVNVDDLLRELAQNLATVRKLRVLDGEWLQTTGLGERVAPLLDSFRARGGQIVFDSTAAY